MSKNLSPATVGAQYQAGIKFNTGIELYDCVETNENFFIGKQWEGVQANGLPTPVFNFLKRVVLFCVANVSTDNLKLHASPMAAAVASPAGDTELIGGMDTLADILNEQFTATFEYNNMGSVIREFARNAAVDGDGATYTYWDPDIETGQASKGGIVTEVLQNTQVIFGNPNCRDVQKQPYLLIERRMMVNEAQKYAKANGASAEDVGNITADEKQAGNVEMDALGGNKVTVILKLWKDEETGTVHGYECTSNAEIRPEWDLGIRLYPVTWMNWDYVQDCYHGQAMITGLIPNQIFVNKLFAMSMISLMSLAYPKVVFDRTKVQKWSNRVGAAIGVTGPVDQVATVVGGAAISPQIAQFIDLAVSYTQRFLGASDVALGDTRPDNTSAIIALQRAAATPMELTKQNLLQCVEDIGRIHQEFMAEYYGERMVNVPGDDGVGMISLPLDFKIFRDVKYRIKLDAGAASYWSEIASMQTLDNLLMQGKIDTIEYLKRLPSGQITDKEALIEALQKQQAAMMGGMPTMGEPATEQGGGGEVPLEGGSGYGELQRKINETGEVPRTEG